VLSLSAGVMLEKWNHSASLNISSKLKSSGSASAIAECDLSYITFDGLVDTPVSKKYIPILSPLLTM